MDNKNSLSGVTFIFLIASVFLSVVSVATYSTSVSVFSHHAAIFAGSLALFNMLPRWIYAMFFEIIALFFVLLIGLFQVHRLVAKPILSKKKTPILLVHGFCNDAGVWWYFRKKLASAYDGPIYTISLRSAFESIELHAKTIHKKVEEILKETNASKIILVGHSMGGLVSCFYAKEYAKIDSILAIITIATPFHGTYAAYLALGKNGKQMRYNSPFTQKLCKQLENCPIPIYQIRTLTDELVIPTNSAFLNQNKERQFSVVDVGHAAMLFSPRVVSQVSFWISTLHL